MSRAGSHRGFRFFVAVNALALFGASVVGCADDDSESVDAGCGIESQVETPVVTVWAALSGNQADTMEQLSSEAESELDVEVVIEFMEPDELVRQLLATDDTGIMPDVVQVPDYALGAVLDATVIDPVQPCIDHTTFDADDFMPGTLEVSQLAGVQWGLPLGWNGLLLAYDRNDLKAAGLGSDPPGTLYEMTEMAQAVRSSGGPSTPVVGELRLFDVLTAAGVATVDRGDGHAGPPTRALAGSQSGVDVFEWADDLVEKSLFDVLDPDDRLAAPFAIAENRGTFALLEARDLWQVGQALRQGQAPDVDLGLGPVPGLGNSGLAVPGDHFFLGHTGDPQRTSTAWRYLSFITGSEGQALWHTGADPLPARRSAAQSPTVQELWKDVPLLAEAWDVIMAAGKAEHVRPRPLIAPLVTFNAALLGLESALAVGREPTVAELMPDVVAAADRSLADYRDGPAEYRECALIAAPPSCVGP